MQFKIIIKIKNIFYAFLYILALASCTTKAVYIENSFLPVSETRKTVMSVIGEPRDISTNGRELNSIYHDKVFARLDEEKKYRYRYYTKIIILGARSPYEVSVQVLKQVYDIKTQRFVDIGLDNKLSQARAIDLKKALKKNVEAYQNSIHYFKTDEF